MTYHVMQVAGAFIDLANRMDSRFTEGRLQKLLYIAQGWHLAITGKCAFEEDFVAREQGPVLPEIDLEFALRGSFPFTEEDASDAALDDDDLISQVILRVWDYYGEAAEAEVDDIATHTLSPWARARAGERLPTRKGESFQVEGGEPSAGEPGTCDGGSTDETSNGTSRAKTLPAEAIRLHFLARATLGRHAIPSDLTSA